MTWAVNLIFQWTMTHVQVSQMSIPQHSPCLLYFISI